jgi:hypothetical protein
MTNYNPLRFQRERKFNTDAGSSVLTENASPITDEQKQAAQDRLKLLIKQTQEALNLNEN